MKTNIPFNHEAFEAGMDAVLHHIDFEDISITVQAAKLISKAAESVMRQVMPGIEAEKLTVNQAVAMFVDHVFWEEGTGGLIMCMDVDRHSYCLPIPPEHWSLKSQPVVLQ